MKALFIVIALALLSGCAQKKVMKDCDKINDGPYFICKKQSEVE
jgi:hypothetical protein